MDIVQHNSFLIDSWTNDEKLRFEVSGFSVMIGYKKLISDISHRNHIKITKYYVLSIRNNK